MCSLRSTPARWWWCHVRHCCVTSSLKCLQWNFLLLWRFLSLPSRFALVVAAPASFHPTHLQFVPIPAPKFWTPAVVFTLLWLTLNNQVIPRSFSQRVPITAKTGVGSWDVPRCFRRKDCSRDHKEFSNRFEMVMGWLGDSYYRRAMLRLWRRDVLGSLVPFQYQA